MEPKVIETLAGWKDPLGYPWSTYLWVLAIASIAGIIKHLNSAHKFKWRSLAVTCLTAGFTGVIVFWLCKARDIDGPMMAVMIAIAGAMGNRCWTQFENIWRLKLGLNQIDEKDRTEDESDDEATK